MHGHSYRAEVFFTAAKLNEDNMVVDFKLVKDAGFNEAFDLFDHALVLSCDDHSASAEACRANKHIDNVRLIEFPGNPTAEAMCRYFYDNLRDSVPEGVRFEKVRIWETATAYAEYEGDHHG